MGNLYPWERLWCPRNAVVEPDSYGFTCLPSTTLYLHTNKHLKYLRDLEETPVLILLGEPGIGKSKALEQEADRLQCLNALHMSVPLDSRDIDHILFDDSQLRGWQQSAVSAKFTLLLDSLDYGRHLLPDIGQLLRNGLRRLSREHLYLRITCRAVEWLPTLEEELHRLWGKDQVSVYHLAPLTLPDVKSACEIENIEFEEFRDEVARVGAGPLASSPVTLGFLFKIFRANNGLPRTRWDTYEQGCMRLAEEVNPYWKEVGAKARSGEKGERFITAGRIALLSLMTNRPEIQEHEEEADKMPQEEITGPPDEAFQESHFSIKTTTVQETLNTGLFSPIRKGVFRSAHQTYSEFLAAYYLLSRQIPLQQLISLFSHPEGGTDLPPQLSATAAWLAMRHEAYRAWAIDQDPTVLLQSDLPALPENERERIAARLLEAAASNRFSAWDVRFSPSLTSLNCSGIAECLRPWLEDATQSDNARVLAVSIAEACKVADVLPNLVEIAISETASKELRVVAGYAIANYGQAEHRLRLKVLLPFTEDDPEEQLRGTALQALWPNLLKTEELLPLLTMPRRSSYHGAYQGFLHRCVEHLRAADLPLILSWLLGRGTGVTETTIGLQDDEESEVRFAGNPFSIPAKSILQRAWQFWDEPAIQPLLLEYLSVRWIKRHRIDLDEFFKDSTSIEQETEEDRRKRRELFVQLIATRNVAEVDLWMLTSNGAKSPLLNQADAEWLWQKAIDATTAEMRAFFVRCAYAFSPKEDGIAEERLKNLCEYYPELLPFKEQLTASEVLRQEQVKKWEQREKREERKKKTHIQKQQEGINEKLNALDEGSLDEWWRLFWHFHLMEDGRSYENPFQSSITQTPAWKEADTALQSRIVASAARYLRDYQPQYEWIGSDTEGRPELAGYRALELLLEREPAFFLQVEASFWRKWSPSIAAAQMHVFTGKEQERQIELIKYVYANTPEEFTNSLKRIVLYELSTLNSLPSHLTSPELYSTYDNLVWQMLWELTKENDLPYEQFLTISEWLLDVTRDVDPLPEMHERVRTKLVSQLHDENFSVKAARILFGHARGAGWLELWPMIQQNPLFGKKWAEDWQGRWFFSDRPLQDLSEVELGDLYEWVAVRYPHEDDPRIDGVHSRSLREQIGNWRNAILQNLLTRETQDALNTLRQISERHSEWKWLVEYTLPRLEKRVRERTWCAASASSILALLSQSERRLVRSVKELETVVLESLQLLQNNLYDGVVSEIEFLWNDNPAKQDEELRGRPKPEEALSNYVAAHLLRELKQRRIIVNREVQVHRNKGRLDIRIEAIPQGRYKETEESVTVVIEVKGCWNRGLKTALKTQLAQDYLRQHPSWRGIYLVGWYLCEFWVSDDNKANTARMFSAKEEATDFFEIQSEEVAHDQQVAVTTFILDARRK